jgi:hypothetical protein
MLTLKSHLEVWQRFAGFWARSSQPFEFEERSMALYGSYYDSDHKLRFFSHPSESAPKSSRISIRWACTALGFRPSPHVAHFPPNRCQTSIQPAEKESPASLHPRVITGGFNEAWAADAGRDETKF